MSTLGDLLRARAAAAGHDVTPIPAPAPYSPRSWSIAPPVGDSKDLQRVLALPRRTLTMPERTLFDGFKREGCGDPACPLNGGLRDIQAAALLEAKQAGGLLAPIAVGFGKTLVSLVLPTVLESKKTVLLVPPSLKPQLLERDYPHLAKHWRIPNLALGDVHYGDTDGLLWVVSYSALSTAPPTDPETGQPQLDLLERLKPDLVVADEAHNVANPSARTRRFKRYFKQNPTANLCALSGTMTSKSIKQYAHLAEIALGAGSPLPLYFPTLQEWSWALDPGDNQCEPGELLRLCGPAEDVRSGFRRRLVETGGVVATSTGALGTSLVFHERVLAPDDATQRALRDLRSTWALPGGEELTDALSFSRAARQLACGVYLRWTWPRGEPVDVRMRWLEARRDWHRAIREKLKTAGPGMDSPLLLARAASRGDWPCEAWQPWTEAKDTARPETEVVWVSTHMVEDAVAWGKKHVGVIWVEIPSVGERIAEVGGFPWFGAGPEASARILKETGKRTVVASVQSHGEGKNMQCFHTQLVTLPSSNGKKWEQLLGRLHRPGQQADEVGVVVYRHTEEMREALKKARDDASYIEATLGSQQKLLAATYTFPL
jgi:hypothetical protein